MIEVARGEGRKQGKGNLSTYLANIFRDRLYPRASHDHDHLLCIGEKKDAGITVSQIILVTMYFHFILTISLLCLLVLCRHVASLNHVESFNHVQSTLLVRTC